MHSLYNKDHTFGILWRESFQMGDNVYGEIKIVIGDSIFPNKYVDDYTLQTVFSNFKGSFIDKYYPGGESGSEFGDRKFILERWDSLELEDVFVIETTELGGYEYVNTLNLCMAYSGKEERLFYSFDNGETFNEIRYPKGTVEKIFSLLPDYG